MKQSTKRSRTLEKRHCSRPVIARCIGIVLAVIVAMAAAFCLTNQQTVTPKSNLHVDIESIIENDPFVAVQYPKTNVGEIDSKIDGFINAKLTEFRSGIPESEYPSELYIKFTTRVDDRNLTIAFDIYMNHANLAHGISETKTFTFDRTGFAGITIGQINDLPVAPELNITPTPDAGDLVDKKLIALTFDDGPHQTYTPQLLDILHGNGTHATFFMLGSRVGYYPDIARRAHDEGNLIGNHTVNHKDLTRLTSDQITAEVLDASATIEKTIGVLPFALRPPYGAYDANVQQAVSMPIILWSVDTLDWKSRNADAIVQHIQSNASDGAIVLMHDIYDSTIEAARRVVPWLKENGYTLVTVEQLAAARGSQLENGAVYSSFK